MSTRVYLPSSTARLRDLLVSGGVGPAPVLAHAVTGPLRSAYPDAGEEELEYAALTAAAQDSVAMLTDEDPARRVVVVADVGSATPVPDGEPSLVELDEVVPLRLVVAVHADDEEAADDVAAARDGLDGEDDLALELLDRCLEHELGWFATQEMADVVGD